MFKKKRKTEPMSEKDLAREMCARLRRDQMRLYGDERQVYCTQSDDGELVEIHYFPDKIIMKTYLDSGFVQVIHYDENGYEAKTDYVWGNKTSKPPQKKNRDLER